MDDKLEQGSPDGTHVAGPTPPPGPAFARALGVEWTVVWGPYNKSWRRLKDATRSSRFYGPRGAGDDVGPVTLHAKGRRSRRERSFDAVVGAYVTTLGVGCATGLLAHRLGGSVATVSFLVFALTAFGSAALVLGSRQAGRIRYAAAVPLIVLGFVVLIGLGLVPWPA